MVQPEDIRELSGNNMLSGNSKELALVFAKP